MSAGVFFDAFRKGQDPGRLRAGALKPADAGALIRAKFPFVYQQMTSAQLDQVQRLLDAAVVNPVVQQEVADIEWKASRNTHIDNTGTKVVFDDPTAAGRIQNAKSDLIPIKEADRYIRLDVEKLLAPDALTPTTDNFDEAAYLLDVKAALARNGVWLFVPMQFVQDVPGSSANWHLDPRTFDCHLLYGYKGDVIETAPSTGGRLTRDVLLSTQAIGAGYWTKVDNGPTLKLLEKAISRLGREIEAGWQRHFMIGGIRRRNLPGVTWVADKLGGGDYPDENIWEQPRALLLQAIHLKAGGNVRKTSELLAVAAVLTSNAARLLNDYIDAYISGADRAVTPLRIMNTAGKIAGIVLVVRSLGMYVLERLSGEEAVYVLTKRAGAPGAAGAGGGAGGGGGSTLRGMGAAGPGGGAASGEGASAAYRSAVAEADAEVESAAPEADSLMMSRGHGDWNALPLEEKQRLINRVKDMRSQLTELTRKKGGGTVGATMSEFEAIMKRVDAKWGPFTPRPPGWGGK